MTLPSNRYTEDELLYISDIQHFCFCPRQWQLISIEQIWADNLLTTQGRLLHRRVDQPEQSERTGELITMRRVPLVSYVLGVYGLSDAVELIPAPDSAGHCFVHPGYPGRWQAIPVEYKRGSPKKHHADKLQLCAQAICLEEMYHTEIPLGCLYYGETRHRERVPLDHLLRQELLMTLREMHRLYREKRPISPRYSSRCRSCSLSDECMPKVAMHRSANRYLRENGLLPP